MSSAATGLPAPPLADRLTDEQMRRFVTDGYLILDSGLPPELHRKIDERLLWVLNKEGNPGNNILPAVPEMQQVLDSPRIRGALSSVLGDDYLLHPHRFAHNNEPSEIVDGTRKAGQGTHAYVGWHQDSHSPLARPRHHYARYAMILYYPQDTPVERGPTQILPASHRHRTLPEEDRVRGFPAAGPAGTCVLVHFDIGHGASMNLSDTTRMMVKFVFARVSEPTAPAWNSAGGDWQTPVGHQVPVEMPEVWAHHWNWLRGRDPVKNAPPPTESIPNLLARLESGEWERQRAIYALATLGEPAVEPLCARLAASGEGDWNEGAVVMEDSGYALAALGRPAIPALKRLLEHPNTWVQINAIFALGEMGSRAAEAVPDLTAKLRHPSHAVVRTTLDALGQIRTGTRTLLPEILRLLREDNPDWMQPQRRAWTEQDQVRLNAMMALVRMGEEAAEAEETVIASLNDPCGYLSGFGTEYLLRRGTPSGLKAALHHLCAHRWDNSLKLGVRTY